MTLTPESVRVTVDELSPGSSTRTRTVRTASTIRAALTAVKAVYGADCRFVPDRLADGRFEVLPTVTDGGRTSTITGEIRQPAAITGEHVLARVKVATEIIPDAMTRRVLEWLGDTAIRYNITVLINEIREYGGYDDEPIDALMSRVQLRHYAIENAEGI